MSIVKFEHMTAEQRDQAARMEELTEKASYLFHEEGATVDEVLGVLIKLLVRAITAATATPAEREHVVKDVIESLQTSMRLTVGH